MAQSKVYLAPDDELHVRALCLITTCSFYLMVFCDNLLVLLKAYKCELSNFNVLTSPETRAKIWSVTGLTLAQNLL